MLRACFTYLLLASGFLAAAQDAEVIVPLGHHAPVNVVITSKDGKIAATGAGEYDAAGGCQGCLVKLWDIASGAELQTITGFSTPVTTTSFSETGGVLAAGGEDGKLVLWDVQNENQFGTIECGKGLKGIFFNTGGTNLITVATTLKMWDLNSRQEISSVPIDLPDLTAAAYDSGSGTLMVAGSSSELLFFRDGKLLGRKELFTKDYVSLAFDQYGGIVAAGHDIDLSGVVTLRIKLVGPAHKNLLYYDNIPEGKLSLSDNGAAYILQSPAGFSIHPSLSGNPLPNKPLANLTATSFSGNGDMVLVATDNKPTVTIFRVKDGSVFSNLAGHAVLPLNVSFGHQDSLLTIAFNDHLFRWNLKTGQVKSQRQSFNNERLPVLSNDRKQLLKVEGRNILLCRNTDNKILKTFRQLDSIYTFCFLRSGKYFIVGGGDKTARLWDIDKGVVKLTFRGHLAPVNLAILSPNDSLLATAGLDQTIKIWDVANGQLIQTFSGHGEQISSLAFSSDGRDLVSASADYSVKFWNLSSMQERATFYALDSTDYMVTTPAGYYMATPNAARELRFKSAGKVFSFSQFDLQFNRPDRVLERLGTLAPESLVVYQRMSDKRIRQMGFDASRFETDRSDNIPEISIQNLDMIPASTATRHFSFNCLIHDALFHIDRINVYVNGVPLYGVSGFSVSTQKVNDLTKAINMELSSGINSITLSVLNEKGVESIAQHFNINYTGAAPVPNLYIVTIGASKYRDSSRNLRYAAKDADDISAAFKSHPQGFGKIIQIALNNQNITKQNFLALKETLMSTSEDDQVMLFYAGHGLVNDQLDYYLATWEMNFSKPEIYGILYADFEGLLDGIPARKKIILIDACHSGEVDKEDTRLTESQAKQHEEVYFRAAGNQLTENNGTVIMNQLFVDLRVVTGTSVIASAGPAGYALESNNWNNGAFTFAILKGLKDNQADFNHDGHIMLSELLQYVVLEVPILTGGLQTPVSRMQNLVNDLRIW
jgi:WD40 repeat protein